MVTAGAPSELPDAEVRTRAARVALVVTDCDGVLTDNGVYYGTEGEVLKRFSIRDGMGVQRLRERGVRTVIVTGEHSPAVLRRAEKLGIEAHLGAQDKCAVLADLLGAERLSPEAVAYIGDDVNDLPAMRLVGERGLLGAPRDALPEVAAVAHYLTPQRGGHGAFRDFAEWILAARERPER